MQAELKVDWLRWWDSAQEGSLIHYWGPAKNAYLRQIHNQGMPVVMTTLFTETCNRSNGQLRRQGMLVRALLGLPGGEGIKEQLFWRGFGLCDMNVVGLEAEKRVLQVVYGVPDDRISIVPLGLSDTYLAAQPAHRSEDHLICTGTITNRKRCLDLAEMARAAQAPVLFVGKPYSESDPYWQRFKALIDGRYVKHQWHVEGEAAMIELLRAARGFVLYSRFENWCLSAHEAIACGLPVLVPDQPWSRERFGDQASYFSPGDSPVEALRRFYHAAATAPAPKVQLFSWLDVAKQLKAVYERVLSASR